MINFTDNPILTVIVPVYNTESYLSKCLDSIVNQSLKNIELLIVNDQSTDNSEIIIKEYAKKYNAIKCFSTSSRSLAGGSRNIGLHHAKGKYIGFVDSDDWIDSNMYEKIVELLERTKADIAVCGVMKEYESPFEAYYKYTYETENVIEGSFAFELLTRRFNQDISISPIACNKVYKSNFLRHHKLAFLKNNYNEDDLFNYLCLLYAEKVAITPNTYYHYYQRNNSITHSFSKKHIDDLFEAFAFIKKHIDDNNLFETHKNHYYAYFERCSAFVLNLMIFKEQEVKKQNKYFQYYLSKSQSFLLIPEYFEYCGAQRLRNFFNPLPIK
jgi:glycosyltransferase involved in cell wall biosynthesis